jgi:hypothetical protein
MARESTLNGLYMQALAAMRTGRHADAITLLDSLLALEPNYRDAADRRDSARRNQRSAAGYERGRAAEAAGNWDSAVTEYTAITDIDPDYRDVPKRLADCIKRQQVTSLLEELRMHCRAGEWQAVIAVGDELTALGLKSAEVDKATKTARQQIRRASRAGHAEPERPEQLGPAAPVAVVTGGQPGEDQAIERAGPERPQGEARFTLSEWRMFYAAHFPILGSIMIVVPLLVLAVATSQIIVFNQLIPFWIMAVFALAGIAGSAIDYGKGCGISAVTVGVNSIWLLAYAVFWLEIVSHDLEGSPNLLPSLYVVAGVGFVCDALILAYIILPFPRRWKRTIDTPLLVFLIFMSAGLGFLAIFSYLGNPHLLWLPGVMFVAALLAELAGIVLTFLRVTQERPGPEARERR